jgi:hypothetical protein
LREIAARQFRVYNLGHVIATGNYMRITVIRNFAAGKIACVSVQKGAVRLFA